MHCSRNKKRGVQLALLFLVMLSYGLLSAAYASPGVVPGNWKTIDAERFFSFSLPMDMEMREVQGKDSYVGKYQSDSIHLSFDYGLYSDPLRYSSMPEYQETLTEIDGKSAKIVSFHRVEEAEGMAYAAAVNFSDVSSSETGFTGLRLTVWINCKGRDDLEVAEMIFRSIRFPIE